MDLSDERVFRALEALGVKNLRDVFLGEHGNCPNMTREEKLTIFVETREILQKFVDCVTVAMDSDGLSIAETFVKEQEAHDKKAVEQNIEAQKAKLALLAKKKKKRGDKRR